MSTHSCVLAPNVKQSLSSGVSGKYSRMFPLLKPCRASETALLALGKAGASMDVGTDVPGADDPASDNPRISAGFPIFGQFIAHDITADRSLLEHHARTQQLHNFRTPRLNLEILYNAGPIGAPYLYDVEDPDKFLLGRNDLGLPNDVPRNSQGRALVGDPRNDVHLPISQLHLTFLKFHNAVVDHLRQSGVPESKIFAEAQRQVQWHYQWIVVSEFLPLSIGATMAESIHSGGRRFFHPAEQPSIPIEFADAAYRVGHSQIRITYRLNSDATGGIFPDCAGGRPVPQQQAIDWRYFFAIDDTCPPQASRRIDAHLAHSLIDLPDAVVGETDRTELHSLACRDLLRGHALDLPPGEAIARAMGVQPLSEEEVGLRDLGWAGGETPLWYYLLREAQVRTGGEYLGDVGGYIVGEVLIGLLEADPCSYLSTDAHWNPTLPSSQSGSFTMADLLRFSGVVSG